MSRARKQDSVGEAKRKSEKKVAEGSSAQACVFGTTREDKRGMRRSASSAACLTAQSAVTRNNIAAADNGRTR